ncbi:tail fiber domain-containing protein [Microbacterium sp. GCS4]|uniref:tail fiber domain-containing protein n=1 Tax=Microbacterium sp. GCS4 TaxID=1692239 RepID=UPI00068017C4|nr:tail fiber domain-containing protein [Microbacterium sp. GCS4]KNY07913.1 hypothetical protein AKH00_06765 [Microbacterium sp. GCS4]
MPLTPTPGNDALDAGMQLTPGTAPASDIDEYINRALDYIAQRTDVPGTPRAIEKGGTGAKTAAAARTNLGVPATGDVALRNALGFLYGVAQLSAHNIGIYRNDGANRTVIRVANNGSQFDEAIVTEGTLPGLMGDTVKTSGGTITGSLFLPNASQAVSGYTVCYINGDGRVSRGASSERYKKFISKIDPAALGDIFPDLYRFQMRQGEPGAWKYGWIAERLAENPHTQPFVVYNEQGAPDSVDFIALLIAQTALLHEWITEDAEQIEMLKQRLDKLEAAQ